MLKISTPRRIISLFALIFCFSTSATAKDFNIIEADGTLNISPIESEGALSDARLLLDNNSIEYRIEDSSYRQSLGFIVVTPSYSNKAAAAGDLRRLADAGVSDYTVCRTR